MMVNSYKVAMERDLDNIGTYHVSGTSPAMMSNRISYFFDWHGPSMYVVFIYTLLTKITLIMFPVLVFG
jgi:acyl transferase domain-containing protein